MSKRISLSAVLVCLLVLAGCGSNGGGSGSAERDAQTSDCPAVEDSAIDPDATFSWMYSGDTTSFDPDKITTNISQMYLYPIYDSLVHIDAKGDPQPMLAKSWDVSDDGLILSLTLIENWSFHDGTPFDAGSVKANLDRHRAEGSWNAGALTDIVNVTAVDASTVEIQTATGAAPLVSILAGSAGMMMSPAVFDDPAQAQHPTGGSGAFEVISYTPGSQVEYAAVDGYWDPESIHVAAMVYKMAGDDNARLNAVITGDVDTTFLRPSMYEAAQEAGLVVCEAPSLSGYTMKLNVQRSEFGSREVREAMNYAVDRDAIAAVMDGFCAPGIQMYPDSYYAASPELTADKYPYDPEKAKDLLAQAGLADGFDFTLEVGNLAVYTQIAEVIQANLQAVGITMNIEPVDPAKMAEDFSVSKTADAVFFEQKAEADPSIQVESYYLPGGFNNPGDWSDPDVTQLAQEARSGSSTENRAASYEKLYDAVHEAVAPNITMCHLTTPFAMNDRTMGVEIYIDASRQFRGVAVKEQA